MKKIQAIPKITFEALFSNEYFKTHQEACFISILDCDSTERKYDTSIENFLQVRMWDIEKDMEIDGTMLCRASEELLQTIVDFVEKNADKSHFIVHCSAGISRSGAVATYIFERFFDECSKEVFRQENKLIQPNLYILKTLRRLGNIIF